jgi:hypothetical protein
MSSRRSSLSRNQKLTLLIALLVVIVSLIAAFVSGHDWFSGTPATSESIATVLNIPSDTQVSPTDTSHSATTLEGPYFPYPISDGYRIDWCDDSATNCGETVALKWCNSHGYAGVKDFTQDLNVGEKGIMTKMLGSGELCNDKVCDSFKSIMCK